MIVNFAAESHNSLAILDPSRFFRTNVLGTQTLAEAARRHGVTRLPPHLDLRGLRRPGARLGRGVHRGDPLPPPDPVQRLEGRRRPRRAGLRGDVRPTGHHHQLLQQLRALPVPREGHPAVHRQGARRPAPAPLRLHAEPAGVAARRRPLPGRRAGAPARRGGGDLQRGQRGRGQHRGDRRRRPGRHRPAADAEGDRPRPAQPRPALPARLVQDPHGSWAGSRPCPSTEGWPTPWPGTRPTGAGGSRCATGRRWSKAPGRRPTRRRARHRNRESDRCGSW